MSKKIITVSREFGSGGRHIAEQVYMPAGESTLHGVLVHGFRSCSALFPVC